MNNKERKHRRETRPANPDHGVYAFRYWMRDGISAAGCGRPRDTFLRGVLFSTVPGSSHAVMMATIMPFRFVHTNKLSMAVDHKSRQVVYGASEGTRTGGNNKSRPDSIKAANIGLGNGNIGLYEDERCAMYRHDIPVRSRIARMDHWADEIWSKAIYVENFFSGIISLS